MKWQKHDRGLVVNLYQIAKMLDYSSVARAREVMINSYEQDKRCKYKQREIGNLTFEEYVNGKRQWMSSVLGQAQYF